MRNCLRSLTACALWLCLSPALPPLAAKAGQPEVALHYSSYQAEKFAYLPGSFDRAFATAGGTITGLPLWYCQKQRPLPASRA